MTEQITRDGWLTDDERLAMRERGQAEVSTLADDMTRKYHEWQNHNHCM